MLPGHARITGTGHHVPGPPLTNAQIIERFGFDLSPEWITERTGIVTRHWLEEGRTTSDMAVDAARLALADAGLEPGDIDRVYMATVTPDYPSPSTATIVTRKLGMRCMAMDLGAACSGFVYALDLASSSIRTGSAGRILVLAADARSRYLDPADYRSVVLFGDGAVAAVVEGSDEPGFQGFHCGAEGREDFGAWVAAGGAQHPTTAQTVADGGQYLRMRSKKHLFPLLRGYITESTSAAMEAAGVGIDEIDWVVPHQGNGVLVDAVLEDLGVPPERGVKTVDRFGSCSGAAMALALATARSEGLIRPGQLALLTTVGAGYTFGSAVHRF